MWSILKYPIIKWYIRSPTEKDVIYLRYIEFMEKFSESPGNKIDGIKFNEGYFKPYHGLYKELK